MPKMKMSFADIPDSKLPAGEYVATVAKVTVKESEAGHPYLNWEFDIADPEYVGNKVWMITSLAPKALWRARDTFEILGFNAAEDLDLEVSDDDDTVIHPVLAGLAVRLEVSVETYKKRERNRVEDILELYGGGEESDQPSLL